MFSFYLFDNKTRKRWRTLAGEFRRRLTGQQIALGNPGTILKDVNTFLEFVGPDGIVTKSRNSTLPADRLPELNAKASYPIELVLKRALLRDYPNLAGIFILLRVMELLQMQGNRLIVCPVALDFWRRLNATEQYFALLEALLFQAQSSVMGGARTREEAQAFESVAAFLGLLTDQWRNFDHYESACILGPQGELPPWNLFVQQQLGLIEIRPRDFSEKERAAWGGRGWLTGGAKLTPWGSAVTWALLEFLKKCIEEDKKLEDDHAAPDTGRLQLELLEGLAPRSDRDAAGQEADSADTESDEEEPEWDEAPGESGAKYDFGMLQPSFQPFFPEWQTIYARPKPEVRSGAHIFKVTLAGWHGGGGSIWRRITVPPDFSLDALAGAILRAFKFDDDHLYDFRYRDQRGRSQVFNHPGTDDGPFTTEIAIAETGLAIKDEMLFTFDYGDNWQFRVRLEKVDPGPCRLRTTKVVESAGKAPKQYPESDW